MALHVVLSPTRMAIAAPSPRENLETCDHLESRFDRSVLFASSGVSHLANVIRDHSQKMHDSIENTFDY